MGKFYVLILISAIFLLQPVKAQKAGDTLPLTNAYFLAKAIANHKKLETERLSEILGGIYWYSKNDIDDVQTIDSFWTSLLHYKILYDETNQIAEKIFPKISLLSVKEEQIKICIADKTKQSTILKLRKEIDTLEAHLSKEKGSSILKDSLQSFALRKNDLLIANTSLSESGGIGNEIIRLRDSIIKFDSVLRGRVKKEDSLLERRDALQKIAESLNGQELQCLNNITVIDQLSRLALAELNTAFTKYMEASAKQAAGKENSASIGFALPSQTQLYDALAIYLVKRVKQESVLWFFEVLKKNVNAYDLVKTCFPNCLALLQSNEFYESPKMGSAWRYAISKDYSMMPDNLFRSEWLKKKLAHKSWILEGLNISWRLSKMLFQNFSYNEIITQLYIDQKGIIRDSSTIGTLPNIINLLFALNEEFYSFKEGQLQRLQFTDLLSMSDREFEIMLDLIDMKYNHPIRNMLLRDSSRININKTKELNIIRKWLGALLLNIQRFESIRVEYAKYIEQKKLNGDLQFQFDEYNVWTFFKNIVGSLELNEAMVGNSTLFKKLDEKTVEVIQLLEDVQEIYKLLDSKNFTGCVNILFDIVQKSYKPKERVIVLTRLELQQFLLDKRLKFYAHVLDSMTVPEVQKKFGFSYDEANNRVTVQPQSLLGFLFKSEDSEALGIIQKLSSFLSDVAYTRDSKELAKVMEAYALPPGSYKKKRANWVSFDLNAYVGAYAGREWVRLRDQFGKDSGVSSAYVYGLTAPIGFALSKTFGKKIAPYDFQDVFEGSNAEHPERIRVGRKSLWLQTQTTLTAFVSVIDIASIVSYRFTSDDEVLPQEVRWAQIFSPGLHLNLGIKGTPLVGSFGYQYTPMLRKLKRDGVDEQLNAHRLYLGLKFDIPLFNFVSKSNSARRYSTRNTSLSGLSH